MSRIFLVLLGLNFFLRAECQNWDSVPGGNPNAYVNTVLYDSIHNKLIVSSKFINRIGSLPVRGIASWDGVEWDSLAGGINTHDIQLNPNNPHGTAYACIPYNGKLLVGGGFGSIGGINATSLALWDGTKWDSLPKRAFRFTDGGAGVAGLYRSGNRVYIYGILDSIAGQPTSGVAYWDGVDYYPIILPVAYVSTIYSVIVYQNELYVAGLFYNSTMTDPKNQILKFDGSNWVSVGGGIPGVVSRIYDMKIYNNELYVCGRFFKSDGNAGEHVQKWDGTQWHDVGFGGEQYGAVWKMIVHHSKLWVVGAFSISAYMPSFGIAVYDGAKWCALQDTIDNVAIDINIYKDTLYVGGGFQNIIGLPNTKYLAKLKNENLYRGCNAIGIMEESNSTSNFVVYPNPVLNTLHILSEQYFEEGTKIEITNSLGQLVLRLNYNKVIDVSTLSRGCYFIKIESKAGERYYSKFIKDV